MSQDAATRTTTYDEKDPSHNDDVVYAFFALLRRLSEKVGPYPLIMTQIGFCVQQVQLMYFALSPAFNYDLPGVKEVSYGVAFFSAPLSDGSFGPVNYNVYVGLVCGLTVVTVATLATFLVAVFAARVSEYALFLKILRGLMETITGWLFLPLMHLFLGGMMCRTTETDSGSISAVYNFSAEEAVCRGALHMVATAIGSFGIVSTAALAILQCWVFDYNADSPHPLSRPHGYYDVLSVIVKTLVVILYHIVVSLANKAGIFSVFALVAFLLLLASLSFIMPYFNLTTASIHGAVLASCVLLAFVNVLSSFDSVGMSSTYPGVKSIIAASVLPLTALSGWFIARVRVSKSLESHLSLLRHYGMVPEHVATIPVPRSHHRSRWHVSSSVLLTVEREMRQDVATEELIARQYSGAVSDGAGTLNAMSTQGSTTHQSSIPFDGTATGGVHPNVADDGGLSPSTCKYQFELFMPYIDRMYIPLDAEVATRFLRCYEDNTGDEVQLSSAQLAYVLRIYKEAISYFTSSPYIVVSLATFLLQYCDRAESAIDFLDEMVNHLGGTMHGVDLMTQYKLYCTWHSAKDVLGCRDSAHLVAYQRARLYHRQALSTTTRFWRTLMSFRSGDQIQLIRISDVLAKQRRSAIKAYRAALIASPDDTVTLLSVADFVEQVLGSKDVAQEVRYVVEDIEEYKRNRKLHKRTKRGTSVMIGGSAGGGSVGGSVYSAGSGSVARSQSFGTRRGVEGLVQVNFDDIIAATRMEDVSRNTARPWQRSFFVALLYISILVSLAGAVVLIALSVSHGATVMKYGSAIQEVNLARGLGYRGMYFASLAGRFYYEQNCQPDPTACTSRTDFLDLLQGVSQAEMLLRAKNSRITFGRFAPAFNTRTYRFLTDGLLGLRYNPHDTDKFHFHGCMAAGTGEEVTLYARFRTQLMSVGTPQAMWTAMTLMSGAFTELVNRLRHASSTHRHYLQFFSDDAADTILDAYTSFARVLAVDIEDSRSTTTIGLSVAMAFVVLGILVGMTAFYISICWIAKNRVQLIGVFAHIPSLFLEQLHDEMVSQLANFDVTNGDLDSGGNDSLGGDSDDDFLDDDDDDADCGSPYLSGQDGQVTDLNNDDDGGDPRRGRSLNRAAQVKANRRFVRSLLKEVPARSCLKRRAPNSIRVQQPVSDVATAATADIRTVRFELLSDDLVDKPKPRLFEPVAFVDGSGEDIIAEFEKSLIEMDKDARRESEMTQRRHETASSDRMITTTYRLMWCNIKETLMKWSHRISLFDRLYTGMLLPILFGVTVAMLALAASTFQVTSESLSEAKAGLTEMSALYTHVAEFDRFDVNVATFINFLEPGYATRIADYVFVKGEFNTLTKHLQRQYDPTITATTELVSKLRLATLQPILADTIYCSVAARAGHARGDFDLVSYPYFAIFFYAPDESNTVFLTSTYPKVFEDINEYSIPTLEDLPTDPSAVHKMVLEMHRRSRFFEDAETIRLALTAASEEVELKITTSIANIASNATSLLFGVVCLSAVFLVAGIAALIIGVRHKLGKIFTVAVVVALLCSLLVLILAPVHMKMMQQKGPDVAVMQDALEDMSQFRTAFYQRLAKVQHYFHAADVALESIREEIFDRAPEKTEMYLNVVKYYPSAASQLNIVRAADKTAWTIQQVGLYLSYASRAKAAGSANIEPPSPPFLSTYSFAKEETYENDLQQFGHDHPDLMYSRPDVDLLRSADELFDMARFAVFGLRGAHYFFAAFDAIDVAFHMIESITLATMERKDKEERTIVLTMIVLSAVAVFCMLVALVLPFLHMVTQIAEGNSRRWLVRATIKASYTNIFRCVMATGVLCAAITVAQFIFILIPMRLDGDVIGIAQNSSARFAGIYRSLTRSLYAQHAVAGDSPPLAVVALGDIAASLDVLTASRQYLYFRDNAALAGFRFVPSLTDDQRSVMFDTSAGPSTSLDAHMQAWIEKLESLLSFTPAVVLAPTADPDNPTVRDEFVIQPGLVSWLTTHLEWFEKNYESIIDGLTRSDDLYRADIKAQISNSQVPAIVFFAVSCCCGLFMLCFVMPWFLKLVTREEQETRALLKVIPKAALDAVPSIALFVDGGVIEDEDEHKQLLESHTFSPNVQGFLQAWRRYDPHDPMTRSAEEICRTHLELHSSRNSGVVLCDAHGHIIFTNTTLLEWTRHDRLIGRNVGVLMPPSVAAIHNQFLHRYMQAPKVGGPRVIDVMACTADGEPLHVIVKKAEAPTRDASMYFIAEIFRYPGTDINARGNRAADAERDAANKGADRSLPGDKDSPQANTFNADSAQSFSVSAFEATRLQQQKQ